MATPTFSWDSFFSTTLAAPITATDTTIALASPPTAQEGVLVIEPNSSTNREIIYYTSVSGSNVVLPSVAAGRGREGTTAAAHSSGVTVKRNTTSYDFKRLQDGSAMALSQLDSNGNTWLTKSIVANAVNNLQIANAASPNHPSVAAIGGLATINIDLQPKGGGYVTKNGYKMDWWEELGRTTVTATAVTVAVLSLPARRYLKVLANFYPAGSFRAQWRFNGDTGANYAYRNSINGGADGTQTSQTVIDFNVASPTEWLQRLEIINNMSFEKNVVAQASQNTTGAANAPGKIELVGKWANTNAQISSVLAITATSFVAPNSEIVVLGHD